MPEIITARQFLTNTFNLDFLTVDEIETIVKAMNLFAIGKCKEQKALCYEFFKKELDAPIPEDLEQVMISLKLKS